MKRVTIAFQGCVEYSFFAKKEDKENGDLLLTEKDFRKEDKDIVSVLYMIIERKIVVRCKKFVFTFDYLDYEDDDVDDILCITGTSPIGDISITVHNPHDYDEEDEDCEVDEEYPDGDILFRKLCKKFKETPY